MKASQSGSVTGSPDPDRRQAFGRALDEAVRSAGSSPGVVAQHVGLSDDAVRKWIAGKSEPAPLTVFAVEQLLGVPPGDLSRHLGYGPVGTVSVTAAIDADKALTDEGREIVRAAYRAARR